MWGLLCFLQDLLIEIGSMGLSVTSLFPHTFLLTALHYLGILYG